MEKCIGCELCAGVCPARCIYVRGADNPPDAPVSPGERYGFVYEINFLRCIHCDMCVEACPTEAITESKLFEWSFVNREDAIYTKAELLVDDEGRPQQLPWEDWKPGDDRNTSAWVRATSPGRLGRRGGRAAVVRRARLRGAARPEGPERPGRGRLRRPTPTCPSGRWRPAPCGASASTGPARPGWRRGGQADLRCSRALSGPPAGLLANAASSGDHLAHAVGVGGVPHRRRADPGRRLRRDPAAQPRPLRPHAGGHAFRCRDPVHRRVRRLPGRGADHRLRRRHRHPVPVS